MVKSQGQEITTVNMTLKLQE